MIILGIDPGSRVTGFGVIKISDGKVSHISHGIISLADQDFSSRLCELGENLQVLLKKYKPEQVAIEKIFLGRNADSAFKLGHARGVAMYAAVKNGAAVYEYATRIVKKGIVGSGAATKEQVEMALLRLLNIKAISKLDASDALAMAVFHAFQITNPLHSLGRSGEARDL